MSTRSRPKRRADLLPEQARALSTSVETRGVRPRADRLALTATHRTASMLRAGAARDLSSRQGNQYVQRLVRLTTEGRQMGIARQPETAWLQRQPVAETEAPPQPALSQDEIDAITSQTIADELESYRNIRLTVLGPELPEGEQGPRVGFQIGVKAAYFINTPAARAHYGPRRGNTFARVVRSFRGQLSTIQGATGRRTVGQAVQLGKATPEEAQAFIEGAIARGVVRRYAISTGALNRRQELVDLGPEGLQEVVQDWVHHVGVGVDCSGFLLTAAIRAREAVRAAATEAGVPEEALPPEISNRERSARSFRNEPRVASPADLRPGDAWVTANGRHIRLVQAVRTVEAPDGTAVVEFDTAESSGTSTQSTVGPVAGTWRTRSDAAFFPVSEVGGTRRQRGSFHRLP